MIAANADSVPLSMSLLHGAQMVFYKTSFYSPTISQLYLPRVTEIDDLLAESTALATKQTSGESTSSFTKSSERHRA
jgi:hypothetical protein